MQQFGCCLGPKGVDRAIPWCPLPTTYVYYVVVYALAIAETNAIFESKTKKKKKKEKKKPNTTI